jgi:hypothetical protein
MPATAANTKLLRNVLIFALLCSATGLGLAYNLDKRIWVYMIPIAIHIALTIALHVMVPQAPKPDYTSPFFPYVPSASLLINAWLCSTLPGSAWLQYAIFLAIMCVIYFTYSIASSLALRDHSALADLKATVRRIDSAVVRVISQTDDWASVHEVGPGGAIGPLGSMTGMQGLRGRSGLGSMTRAGVGSGTGPAGGDAKAIEGKKAVELV